MVSASVKSDADLKRLADAFFGAALNAVCNDATRLSGIIAKGHFRLVKGIVFDDNDTTQRLLYEMVVRCIKLLGTKVAYEREISALAWEQVAEYLARGTTTANPQIVAAQFFDALDAHARLQFVYVVSNYAIRFAGKARAITVGPVQAVFTEDLLPALLRDKTNSQWTVTTGAKFRVSTTPSGIDFRLPPIVWRVVVSAAKGLVEEEATWLINIALSLLRLSYPQGRYDFFPDVGDREALPLDEPLWDNRGLIFAKSRVSGGGFAMPLLYVVDDSIVAISNTLEFQKCADAIFAPGKGAVAERFGAGLGWLTRGRQSADRAERFLYFFTAVEALLSSDDKTAPLIQTIARYVAVILQDDAKARAAVAKRMKALYASRSGLVHAGKREVAQSAVNEIQNVAEHLYKTVLEKMDLTTTFTSFQQSLSEASFGLPWP